MLRRADNVSITFNPNPFTGNGWVMFHVGQRSYQVSKRHSSQMGEASEIQLTSPIIVAQVGERIYWQYQNKFYWENDGLSPEEVHALLATRHQRERQRIDRAQAMVTMDAQPHSARRGFIADDIKQFVWARDDGRCRNCGSSSELQFDHIISIAMGGSSEAANLQILCGPCNRRKGSGLTIR
jgi:5-methylcytosine-specific restriction endonuclease McrA